MTEIYMRKGLYYYLLHTIVKPEYSFAILAVFTKNIRVLPYSPNSCYDFADSEQGFF